MIKIRDSIESFKNISFELKQILKLDFCAAVIETIVAFYVGMVLFKDNNIANLSIMAFLTVIAVTIGFQIPGTVKNNFFKENRNIFRLSFVLMLLTPLLFFINNFFASFLFGFAHGLYWYAWFVHVRNHSEEEEHMNFAIANVSVYLFAMVFVPSGIWLLSNLMDFMSIQKEIAAAVLFVLASVVGFITTFKMEKCENIGTDFKTIVSVFKKSNYLGWSTTARIDMTNDLIIISFINFTLFKNIENFSILHFVANVICAIILFSMIGKTNGKDVHILKKYTKFLLVVTAMIFIGYGISFVNPYLAVIVISIAFIAKMFPYNAWSGVISKNEIQIASKFENKEAIASIILRDLFVNIGRALFCVAMFAMTFFMEDKYVIFVGLTLHALSYFNTTKMLTNLIEEK